MAGQVQGIDYRAPRKARLAGWLFLTPAILYILFAFAPAHHLQRDAELRADLSRYDR